MELRGSSFVSFQSIIHTFQSPTLNKLSPSAKVVTPFYYLTSSWIMHEAMANQSVQISSPPEAHPSLPWKRRDCLKDLSVCISAKITDLFEREKRWLTFVSCIFEHAWNWYERNQKLIIGYDLQIGVLYRWTLQSWMEWLKEFLPSPGQIQWSSKLAR